MMGYEYMPDIRSQYWEILNEMADLIEGGIKRDRSHLVESASPTTERTHSASGGRSDQLVAIADEIAMCDRCQLCETRTKTVPGVGVLDPKVMFIGEGPGADEDTSGLPFVGRAGQYLDKWMAAIGLNRETNSFIGNIVKCRPPGNRDPEQGEMESCLPYLYRQLESIRPRIIVALGRISSQVLCGSTLGIGKLRGGTYDYLGIPIIPTYHPSGVLRNPEYRPAVWEDLQRVQQMLESGA